MNKSPVMTPPAKDQTQFPPKIGFTIHTPFAIYLAVKEAAHRDNLSISKWVAGAIVAKLEANGK